MAFDASTFKPASAADLADGVARALSQAGSSWFQDNAQSMQGYLAAIGEAVIQTHVNLTIGRIDRAEAATLMAIHGAAFRAQMAGLRYDSFELRQRLLDTAVGTLAHAVRNLTGINLAPHLIAPH